MKEFLLYVSIIFLLIGCKNELKLYDGDTTVSINMIKADFERATAYKQTDSAFINPSFKSAVDWKTFYKVGQDTLYVKVKVFDRLEFLVSDSTRILLNDNIWIRGTRKNDEWQYSVLTFIPSSRKAEYSGIIISKSLQSGAQHISFYEADTKVPTQLMKRAGKAPAMPTDCIYGYVNGSLNEISCSGGSGDDDGSNDPPYSGDPRDYQNFPPPGGGGGGSGGDGTVPTYTVVPTVAKIKEQLKDKPFALIPNIPCDIIKKWIATAKFTVDQSTISKIQKFDVAYFGSPVSHVQNINTAFSPVVNMDYFPITVNKLPLINGKASTPEQFLEHFRKNINKFINTDYSEFVPYDKWGVEDKNLWNSSNPKNAVIAIDIAGPDNGSVIVSKFNSEGWTFTTIFEPSYQKHPVSGHRDFGFTKNTNGSYTFYTRGVDRLTNIDGSNLQSVADFFGKPGLGPFSQADALWTSYQKMVSDFVNKNGGAAVPAKQEIHRPEWATVKAVLEGKAPLSTLSTDCK